MRDIAKIVFIGAAVLMVGLALQACRRDRGDEVHRLLNDPVEREQVIGAMLERHDLLDVFYARIMNDERATKHLISELCADRRTAGWMLDQMMEFPDARDAMVEKLIEDDDMREKMVRRYELFRRP